MPAPENDQSTPLSNAALQSTSVFLEDEKVDSSEIDPSAINEQDILPIGEIAVATILQKNAEDRESLFEVKNQLKSKNLVILLLSIAVAMLIAGFLYYPKTSYIATSNNLAVCSLSAENNPNLTHASIAAFANAAVINAYSFDYVSWQNTLEYTLNNWFTPQGKQTFISNMRNSGSLDHLITNNLILRTINMSVPEVVEQNTQNGTPYWLVRVKIRTEYYDGKTEPVDEQNFMATIRVTQVPASALNTKGIAVELITLAPENA